jgi:acylphosphatase
MTEIARRLAIEGMVQGVGYRYWAAQEAERCGLRGWVRNRADRTVEALCIGPETAVERFIAACSRGPAAARVTGIAVTPAADDGSPGFEIRATA